MSTDEELRDGVRQIEAALDQIARQELDASFEARRGLMDALSVVRGSVCRILSAHITDPLLTRFDALAGQCDQSVVHMGILQRLRDALLRKIAVERFGLRFDPQADLEGNRLLRGALMVVYTYTFRDDLPYQGDRSCLTEIITLFPDVPFPR